MLFVWFKEHNGKGLAFYGQASRPALQFNINLTFLRKSFCIRLLIYISELYLPQFVANFPQKPRLSTLPFGLS
jgi:hypothetical protein